MRNRFTVGYVCFWHISADPPTPHHLQVLFNDTQYAQWLLNTGIVGIAVVIITPVLAVPAGYALASMTGPWAQTLGVGIFLTYLVPPAILFIPFGTCDIGVARGRDRTGSLS